MAKAVTSKLTSLGELKAILILVEGKYNRLKKLDSKMRSFLSNAPVAFESTKVISEYKTEIEELKS